MSKLLMKRPAEMSNVIESAICAVASDVRNLDAERAPEGCPESPLRAVTSS